MPPDIVGPNTTYLHKVSLSFRFWKGFIINFFFFNHIDAVLEFPTGFSIKCVKDDKDSFAHKPTTKHRNSIFHVTHQHMVSAKSASLMYTDAPSSATWWDPTNNGTVSKKVSKNNQSFQQINIFVMFN